MYEYVVRVCMYVYCIFTTSETVPNHYLKEPEGEGRVEGASVVDPRNVPLGLHSVVPGATAKHQSNPMETPTLASAPVNQIARLGLQRAPNLDIVKKGVELADRREEVKN